MARLLHLLLTIFCCFQISLCTTVEFTDCDESDPKGSCKITHIDIEPCTEPATIRKPCKLKKIQKYTIKMNMEVLEPMETFKSIPYWVLGKTDVPFLGMDIDGCHFAACPLTQNSTSTYNYQLVIDEMFPRGAFYIKWKFWTENQGCCTKFALKLNY